MRHPHQRPRRSEPVFHPRLPRLPRQRTVLQAPEDTYTFSRLADDLEELRRHLNLGSVPVLAHSMGGLVAMEFALRHESAKSVILAGVTPCMSPAEHRSSRDQGPWLSQNRTHGGPRAVVPGRLELASREHEEDSGDVRPYGRDSRSST